MILLEENYELTDNQTRTNVEIPFEMTENYTNLQVHVSYGPDWSSDSAARKQVREAIEQYVIDGAPEEEYIVENYLPIENFITLSMSKDKQYLGGHHNKMKQQTIEINEESASLGFWPTKIESAE